jgi:hypothetical protein
MQFRSILSVSKAAYFYQLAVTDDEKNPTMESLVVSIKNQEGPSTSSPHDTRCGASDYAAQ